MDKTLVEAPRALLPTAAGCIGFLIFLSYVVSSLTKSSTRRRLPPGPKPKPIIGNLLDLAPSDAKMEDYYMKHRELYGPISSLSTFGTNMILINDAQVAKEILEKRSAKYAARPVLNMAGGLVGFDRGMVLTQPGDRFREMRRVSHNQLGSTTTVARWGKEISVEVNRYLLRILEDPAAFRHHIRKEAGTIILKILYGYQVSPDGDDPLVDIAEQVMQDFADVGAPGAWLVDTIPALAYLPEWFPGAGFKRFSRECRERLDKMTHTPYEFAKRQVKEGIAPKSVLSETLGKLKTEATAEDEDIISWALFGLYAGGADTTVAFMEIFFLAMILYPDVLRKAQDEIDSVIGNDRLPDEHDRARLPYVDALFKELVRWEPIGEIVMPHSAMEDDTYGDYVIPKNSLVMPYLFGFYRDPSVYTDPTAFKPERYLGEKPELDPMDAIWGYGRRLCPGRHLAVWNTWLEVSRSIAVFNIKAVEGHLPTRDFTAGFIRRPKHFLADIKVRSSKHEWLIRAVEEEAPMPTEGDGKHL